MKEFDYNYSLDEKDDTYKIKIGSTFDSIRQISNPKSLYFLLKKYYYNQIISYNVANYSAINFVSKLIISKNINIDLLGDLNKSSINKFTEFSSWDGKSVAGIDFENLWYYKILNSNLFQRLTYYLKSFYLTSIEITIAKNAPKEILDFKLKALKEGADKNYSKFERFKCYYFSRKLKKIRSKIN